MHITVTFRHFESTDEIKKHVEEKLEKAKKYLTDPIEAHVILSVEKFRTQCEITLSSPHFHATAISTTDEDLYSAIDVSVHKLEKQLRKHKEIVTEHKQHLSKKEVFAVLNAPVAQ